MLSCGERDAWTVTFVVISLLFLVSTLCTTCSFIYFSLHKSEHQGPSNPKLQQKRLYRIALCFSFCGIAFFALQLPYLTHSCHIQGSTWTVLWLISYKFQFYFLIS